MSVTRSLLRSYKAPREVVRGLRGRAGERREARILVYLMVACALFFVAQWPRLAREAHLSDEVPLEGLMAAALFGWIFVAPLLFYTLATVLTLLLKTVNRAVEGFDVRLALFWALLVASPFALLNGLTNGMVATTGAAVLTGLVLAVVFLLVLGAGLRVALEAARGAD